MYLNVVLGMTPVALGIDVAEIEALLHAALDAGDGTSDLASHKGGTCKTLMDELAQHSQ